MDEAPYEKDPGKLPAEAGGAEVMVPTPRCPTCGSHRSRREVRNIRLDQAATAFVLGGILPLLTMVSFLLLLTGREEVPVCEGCDALLVDPERAASKRRYHRFLSWVAAMWFLGAGWFTWLLLFESTPFGVVPLLISGAITALTGTWAARSRRKMSHYGVLAES